MISPFAGLFYARGSFGFLLETLSGSPYTAWLNGFFLNHSVITRSFLLEAQREIGEWMLLLGLGGFALCALRVYKRKAAGGGVVGQGVYRFVRHPQYLFLAIAGWGLLTSWPRFLLLGIWMTMLFLYAFLARFEEQRMVELYGEQYRRFAASRGSFLPGSPVRRLFEATFGRLRPRALGWASAYVVCLAMALAGAFALRSFTIASSAHLFLPERQMLVLSVWPESDAWMRRISTAALTAEVQQRIDAAAPGRPIVATILTPRYGMKDMFYKRARTPRASRSHAGFPSIYRTYMGRDPASTEEPVEVVFSRAERAYSSDLSLSEVFEPGILLVPIAVIAVDPKTGATAELHLPLPQNAWGANVVMPIL